jgi:long-chain acyl-CoA synthetase
MTAARTAAAPMGSLREMLGQTLERHPGRPALSYRLPSAPDTRRGRAWRTLSWLETARLTLDVAGRLSRWGKTPPTVAILADTDARYPLLELGTGLAGGAVQPLYVSATDDELREALGATSASLLVVGRFQSARGARLHSNVIALERLVRLPGAPTSDEEPFDTSTARARLAALPARDPEAPLLYLQSTGTTGPARVIELGERALRAAVEATRGEASHRHPRFLSFLPTAHISERLLTLYLSLALGGHTYYGGGLATFAQDLTACRPTVFLAPPLLLETLRSEIGRAAEGSAIGRRLLASVARDAEAFLTGGPGAEIRRSIPTRLCGALLWRRLGLDRVRDALAGTAPLAPALGAWFAAAGLPVRDVYGQTELCGATSITPRRGATPGTVGRVVPGVEVRVSHDQELLVRSRSTFTRYVGDPAATRRALRDGWVYTGDRARLLDTGEILLLGRIQSRFPTAAGASVDTAAMGAALRAELPDAEVVLARPPETADVYLYVARPPTASSAAMGERLRPLPVTDLLSLRLPDLVEAADPLGVIRGWALFEGAFSQTTGEVGPTGKPRAWRIHALRKDHLVARADAPHEAPLRDRCAPG